MAERLGRELSRHRVHWFDRLVMLGYALFAALLALLLLVPAVLGGGFGGFLAVLASLGLGAWSFVWFRRFSRAQRTLVVVREAGFSHSEGAGVREVRWDDVTGVWAEFSELAKARTPQSIVGIGVAGARGIVLPKHLEAARVFAEHVQKNTEGRIRVEVEAAIDEGKTVSFGPVSVDQRYLWVDDKFRFRWDAVAAVRLSFDKLEVRWVDGGHALYPTEGIRKPRRALRARGQAHGRAGAALILGARRLRAQSRIRAKKSAARIAP